MKKKTWQQSRRKAVGQVVALVVVVFFLKALNNLTQNSFSHCGEAVFVFLWSVVETAQTGTRVPPYKKNNPLGLLSAYTHQQPSPVSNTRTTLMAV